MSDKCFDKFKGSIESYIYECHCCANGKETIRYRRTKRRIMKQEVRKEMRDAE